MAEEQEEILDNLRFYDLVILASEPLKYAKNDEKLKISGVNIINQVR